jgi:hypothetical protein
MTLSPLGKVNFSYLISGRSSLARVEKEMRTTRKEIMVLFKLIIICFRLIYKFNK